MPNHSRSAEIKESHSHYYAHLSDKDVKTGDILTAGRKIGGQVSIRVRSFRWAIDKQTRPEGK
jgi:hypothetical protein